MSPAFQMSSFCLLSLSLGLSNSFLTQPQSSRSVPNSSQAESAVREVAVGYFVLFAAKDIEGVMRLWSENSPAYPSLKQDLQRQFATEDFSISDPVISRVKVEIDKASLRAMTNLTAVNLKSNEKREQRIVRNFDLVMEDGKWKIWRSASAEDDLAEVLVNAKTQAERDELLAAEKELSSVDLARALSKQGDGIFGRSQYPQALMVYTLAHALAMQFDDRNEIARNLHGIGRVHVSQGNFPKALEFFQKSLAAYEALGDQAGIGRTFVGIGMIHWLQGDYAQALALYNKSLDIFESLGSKADIARAFNNIGNVLRYQGDFAQALEYFQRSLTIRQELNDTFGILSSLGNIGVVYGVQGNYAKALEYYEKSLAMSEETDDKEGIAITLGNIGVLYRKQGNYEQALNYYRKSLAISEAIEDRVGIAQMLNNIGSVNLLQRNYAPALDHYQRSLAMREQMGDKHGAAHTMMAIGITHTSQSNFVQALDYLKKSLTIKEAIKDRDGVASVLANIAIYHKEQKQYDQALDFAERATTLARQIGSPIALSGALVAAGQSYRALNKLDQARPPFEEAITVIETMRSQVAGSEQAQQLFFENKLTAYHEMVNLLLAQDNSSDALIFTERAKARALVDLLYSGRVNIVKAVTSQEQEQERTFRSEIISLNTQLSRARQQEKPDDVRLTELASLLEKARLNYEAFQTSLYAAHPELRVQRGEAPVIKIEEIDALIPDTNTALLEYLVMEDLTYVFAISKKTANAEAEVRVYAIPLKRIDLARQVEAFRQKLAARDLGFRASASKLYELLLKPTQAQLRGKTNLIISADDSLWDLPFQALLTSSNRFLIDEATISYTPSLTVLREMTRRRKSQPKDDRPATLLALGNPTVGKEATSRTALTFRDGKLDPLPEAEQEVKALGRLYGPARSKVYIGAEAREDRIKSEATGARILHFAAHGMLNNAAPMYSHLALAEGDSDEDGLLEAWELMQLDLKAELAVLSACETARGRIGAGEGMIGLSWAMFIAGVPSIVVSQWKVESAATRDLMVNFHSGLLSTPKPGKANPTKAEALRQATLKLKNKPETSHPFYWAGFVLVGDGR